MTDATRASSQFRIDDKTYRSTAQARRFD